ncbi:hypothetical protein [Ohtaekwangia sp.]|uniref:hypothetical protein n=1 Tax=Ohtaekwangia sp. TaxID=2066019 RepID=UPI002FDE8661
MKRFLSIAFIVLLFLNTIGYYGVFVGLYHRNDVAMNNVFDSDNYSGLQLITIKIPVSIPYLFDQTDFERAQGEFQHEGEFYRLVKQRYAKDTLTVLCVKDDTHKKIDRALKDYVRTFGDNHNDSKSTLKITVNFLKDYLPQALSIYTVSPGWVYSLQHNSFFRTLIPAFTASIIHPPERA